MQSKFFLLAVTFVADAVLKQFHLEGGSSSRSVSAVYCYKKTNKHGVKLNGRQIFVATYFNSEDSSVEKKVAPFFHRVPF